MTPDRFEVLSEAYGSRVELWPTDVRDAARAWVARNPDQAGEVLGRAARLDSVLDTVRPPVVSHALRERVIALAVPAQIRSGLRWLWGAGVGFGLAATCAAGLVLGVIMSGQLQIQTTDEPVTSVMTGYQVPTDSGEVFL